MENVKVMRVFGRVSENDDLERFVDWFADNVKELEPVADEENPKNGFLTLDWQQKTKSFIVEIRTTNGKFVDKIIDKFNELNFNDYDTIGIMEDL